MPEHKILVAVSGGVDSVVLLHLIFQADFVSAIVHCNFQLRAEESDEDEALVRQLAKKYQLELYVKNCDAAAYSKEKKVGIQEAARELRYRYFDKVMIEQGFDRLATGHNRDDDVENFFIGLSRSAGLKGLAGIPRKREYIIRPLLFASRKKILDFASQQQLTFREDSSNISDKYLRNRIRHHLVPALYGISAMYYSSIVNSIEHLRDATTLLGQLLAEKREQLLKKENDIWQLSLNEIDRIPNKELLLFYILQDFGFDRQNIARLCLSIDKAIPGKRFYSNNYELLLDRNTLFIRKKKKANNIYLIIPSFDWQINSPVLLNFHLLNRNKDFFIEKNKFTAFFDSNKLKLPLILRNWQQGDRFQPFGMKGLRLVSDLLTDEKLSLFEKEQTFVLLSNNTIIWVIGYRVSGNFKVSENTSSVLRIKIIHGIE